MNITKSMYLMLGHSFKDNEGIPVYMRIGTTLPLRFMWPKHKYISGIIQVSQLVLWEKYVWLLKRLTENRPVLEVG